MILSIACVPVKKGKEALFEREYSKDYNEIFKRNNLKGIGYKVARLKSQKINYPA